MMRFLHVGFLDQESVQKAMNNVDRKPHLHRKPVLAAASPIVLSYRSLPSYAGGTHAASRVSRVRLASTPPR
jgi:hypothetical protein